MHNHLIKHQKSIASKVTQYLPDIDFFQEKILNFEYGIFRGNDEFESPKGVGKIGFAGYLLGILTGVNIGIFVACHLSSTPFISYGLKLWCYNIFFLSVFHFLEFFVTAVHQPKNCSYSSYMINHSKSYTIALLAAFAEFWIEFLLLGNNKFNSYTVFFGFVMVLLGQFARTFAMWQCGRYFNHMIMEKYEVGHKLITTGIFRYLRHPSYFGFFYWSIGTQLILCNPISVCAYTYASWTFFNGRIPYEERLLLDFYKQQYKKYCESTFIGIPFVGTLVKPTQWTHFQMRVAQSLNLNTDFGENNMNYEYTPSYEDADRVSPE